MIECMLRVVASALTFFTICYVIDGGPDSFNICLLIIIYNLRRMDYWNRALVLVLCSYRIAKSLYMALECLMEFLKFMQFGVYIASKRTEIVVDQHARVDFLFFSLK